MTIHIYDFAAMFARAIRAFAESRQLVDRVVAMATELAVDVLSLSGELFLTARVSTSDAVKQIWDAAFEAVPFGNFQLVSKGAVLDLSAVVGDVGVEDGGHVV